MRTVGGVDGSLWLAVRLRSHGQGHAEYRANAGVTRHSDREKASLDETDFDVYVGEAAIAVTGVGSIRLRAIDDYGLRRPGIVDGVDGDSNDRGPVACRS